MKGGGEGGGGGERERGRERERERDGEVEECECECVYVIESQNIQHNAYKLVCINYCEFTLLITNFIGCCLATKDFIIGKALATEGAQATIL